MPEATMICVDNSEWMRNGDFVPSRLDAQRDAINMLLNAKINGHAENTVGLVSTAEGREVLATLTNDIGRLLNRMHGLKTGATMEFAKSVQIAQLALKYRQAKNHSQRIVVFVGSPLEDDEKELVKLAKKLKKNNVNVDVINFGEAEANTAKLEAFVENANKDGASHLVTVPAGVGVLSDVLISSPIFGEGSAPVGGGGGEFGFDPNVDPELAMALRVSMEEARMAQQQTSGPAAGAPAAVAGGAEAPMVTDAAPNFDAMTEEEQLQWVLRESARMSGEPQSAPVPATPAPPVPATPAPGPASTPAAPAAASTPAAAAEPPAELPSAQNLFSDPAFLSSVLGSLPGVDANDESIRSVLSSLAEAQGQPPAASDKSKDDEKKKEDGDHMQE